MLFVKYVSDKYAKQKYGAIVVPAGGSFTDMVALKGQKDIGDKMNTIIGELARANDMAWLSNPDNDFNNEDRLSSSLVLVTLAAHTVDRAMPISILLTHCESAKSLYLVVSSAEH